MTGSYSDEDFIARIHARGIEGALERLSADYLIDQTSELCRLWRELEQVWERFDDLCGELYDLIGEEE